MEVLFLLAAIQQINKDATYRINDLNRGVYCFWKELKAHSEILIKEIYRMRMENPNGKELFKLLIKEDSTETSDLESAVKFFIINRITFSEQLIQEVFRSKHSKNGLLFLQLKG